MKVPHNALVILKLSCAIWKNPNLFPCAVSQNCDLTKNLHFTQCWFVDLSRPPRLPIYQSDAFRES